MARRVLLLGSGGMLGRAFTARLAGEDAQVVTRDLPAFDLSRREHVDALPVGEVDVVINCAAWTDVDGAETQEPAATVLNGDAVGWLAGRCAEAGTTVVHFSTDYVFDGRATTPYPVDHPRAPVNAYGRSKAVGEERLVDAGGPHLLVRTSWLYAPWAKNFVRTMAALGRSKQELRVVDDQRGRPTSAEHLAASTLQLVDGGHRGIAHVTDGGECTWHGLASAVIGRVAPHCRVLPCTSDEFPRPAVRPAYSVLDIAATEAALGRSLVPWRDAVDDVLARLES